MLVIAGAAPLDAAVNLPCASTVISHEGEIKPNLKRSDSIKTSSNRFSSKSNKADPNLKQTNILSDAITNARKMNPKLGFKK